MNWEALLNGALGAGLVGIVYKLLDHYFARSKTAAEAKLISSEEKENTAETAGKAVGVLGQVLDELRQDRKELQEENREYKALIKELKTNDEKRAVEIRELQEHRNERTKQIDELTENNEALTAQVAALQTKIARDMADTRELQRKYQELEKKYVNSRQALELILGANANLIIPPDVKLLLGDSITGFKWDRPQV